MRLKMNAKQLIGDKATEYIQDGMIVGLGTGSTAYWAIQKIGQLVQQGLRIKGVPTSNDTEKLAQQLGIPLIRVSDTKYIDLTIDGADEFNVDKHVIKGGGGALLREKIIASMTNYYIIIADNSKKVDVLFSYPLPVEVTPFAWETTCFQLKELGCSAKLRIKDDHPFVTDNQNFIIDCKFDRIEIPEELSIKLNRIPGVVENGLFVNMANLIITTDNNERIVIIE